MLPPYELRNKEFSKVMRGYNPVEVDEHISFIIEKYTELYRENDELERRLKTAYAKLDEIKTDEESIRSAMINAQRASSKIMTEANDRADIILNTARKSCDRILADFRKKIQEERNILIALNSAISDFKEKLFKTYNSHISFIEEIKLLDENEIVKYALSDENFTACVIQSIKQDIVDMTKAADENNNATAKATNEEPEVFVEANLVKQEPVVRSNSVKDTIKKLNKRFLEDENTENGVNSTEDIPSEAEVAADKEYNEMLKELGVEKSVDVEDVNEETKDSTSEENDKKLKNIFKK